MHLFGDLYILSLNGISVLNWIGHVNRMDSKRNIGKIFNNNPQGSRLTERPKNRWRNYVQTDINRCKITNWTKRSKTKLTRRRRRRCLLLLLLLKKLFTSQSYQKCSWLQLALIMKEVRFTIFTYYNLFRLNVGCNCSSKTRETTEGRFVVVTNFTVSPVVPGECQ